MNEDGKVVLVEKAVRTVPYGFLGVLFSVYLSKELGLGAFLIGVVLALTVASSAIYTLVASVFADRIGRKRTLIFFALTDAMAGALLFSSDSLWVPVAAGIVGNMTVGAGRTRNLRFIWSLNGCPPRNKSHLVSKRPPNSRI